MRRAYHGGQNARDWRRQIAALAKRQREDVRTLKFRLDCRSGDLDFQAASQACDVTEGVGQGSLIGLVCAVHLSGFRLFTRASETRRFQNRSRYPEGAFSDALKAHAGIENSRITIQSIEDVFATPPRARGGSAPAWSADDLARRLFQTWNGRSPREGDAGQPAFDLAAGTARAVAREFDGWRNLADDKEGALISAGRHLATLGASFPRLDDLPTGTDFQPESCTFACDPESPFVDKESPKLNRISGGTADATAEIARLEADLNAATRARREHFQRLSAWATGNGDLVRVPALLSAQLDAGEVFRDVAVRAFNLFNNAINGLSFRAFRESFIVRVKFQRRDREELFYAPT